MIVAVCPSDVIAFGVMVTVFPLKLTVATLGLLDVTLNTPPLVFFVIVKVFVVGYVDRKSVV